MTPHMSTHSCVVCIGLELRCKQRRGAMKMQGLTGGLSLGAGASCQSAASCLSAASLQSASSIDLETAEDAPLDRHPSFAFGCLMLEVSSWLQLRSR